MNGSETENQEFVDKTRLEFEEWIRSLYDPEEDRQVRLCDIRLRRIPEPNPLCIYDYIDKQANGAWQGFLARAELEAKNRRGKDFYKTHVVDVTVWHGKPIKVNVNGRPATEEEEECLFGLGCR